MVTQLTKKEWIGFYFENRMRMNVQTCCWANTKQCHAKTRTKTTSTMSSSLYLFVTTTEKARPILRTCMCVPFFIFGGRLSYQTHVIFFTRNIIYTFEHLLSLKFIPWQVLSHCFELANQTSLLGNSLHVEKRISAQQCAAVTLTCHPNHDGDNFSL